MTRESYGRVRLVVRRATQVWAVSFTAPNKQINMSQFSGIRNTYSEYVVSSFCPIQGLYVVKVIRTCSKKCTQIQRSLHGLCSTKKMHVQIMLSWFARLAFRYLLSAFCSKRNFSSAVRSPILERMRTACISR